MGKNTKFRKYLRWFLTGIIIALAAILARKVYAASPPGIVPAPVSVKAREGFFAFGHGTGIYHNDAVSQELAEYLSEKTGRRAVPVCATDNRFNVRNTVMFSLDYTIDMAAEGYTLDISPHLITIEAGDRAGLFYGIQTLLQLMPAGVLREGFHYDIFDIPCISITDYPRFGYRGFSLDVARTFTAYDDIIDLLNRMAFHKLNRFHWHLTDDEGWRLPLRGHPRLAAEAGFRGAGSPVHNIYGAWGRRYGGYYEPDEVRSIIDHAALLNIEVVPEFDLPGHSRAIARIYPEILCRGPVDTTASAGYDLRKVWCAGREENFHLIGEILDEICSVFPGALIHTGGDEVPPEQWEICPDCQALMKREGMKDTKALNTWFENRVGEMVADRGRRQAVWNEAIDGSQIHGDPVIWAWENEMSVVDAVNTGYATVNMTSQYYYFDMKQSQAEVGLAWGGVVDLRKTYDYEPVPAGSGAGEVIGVEGGLWTETLLWNGLWWRDYQIYPRLCALAETAWSPASVKNFSDFESRLVRWHYERLAALGVAYRDSNGIRHAPTVPADRMKIAYEVTGSVPCTSRNPYSYASDNDTRTFARTVRTARAGDWFEFRFRTPVECSSITVRSGYSALPRFVIGPAILEACYDGKTYETIDENFGYTGSFTPHSAVHSLRLTVTGDGNGEDAVIIQDLVVMK